ncbi:MAG: hypothetical protein FJ164_06910 [Gammaproteobacteria bacterium]|nr:hypothetical protein [Gammaproteobacteria bacterium]
MDDQAWKQAGQRLLGAWLRAMGPGADAFAASGLPPQGAASDPTASFQDLAELLCGVAESAQAASSEPVSMTKMCLALIEWLETQLAGLRATVLPALAPWLAWLDTQTHPVLGIGREHHARWAALARAGLAHGKALQHLHGLHLEVLQTALGRCREGLLREDEVIITSLHGLSGWWAETVDTAYRERALEADYARAFGGWVNSASALRQAWSHWQSAQAAMMGPWFSPSGTTRI